MKRDGRITVRRADGSVRTVAADHFARSKKRKPRRGVRRTYADGVLRTNAEWRQIREMFARRRGEA